MSNAPTEVTGLVLGYRLSLRTYQVTEGQPASLYSHGRCEAPYLLLRSASHFEKVFIVLDCQPPWFLLCPRLQFGHSKTLTGRIVFGDSGYSKPEHSAKLLYPQPYDLSCTLLPWPRSHIWLTPNIYTAPATVNASTLSLPRAPFILRATPV